MKLLFASTPVAPLGTGLGGGVELTLHNVAREVRRRGHEVTVIAPAGSVLGDLKIVEIPGQLQILAQTLDRGDVAEVSEDSVLKNMWAYARKVASEYDIALNFAYDALPFALTADFPKPIAHLVSMGSLTEDMDRAIQRVAEILPRRLGFHSYTQAATFGLQDRCRCVSNAIDISLYEFCDRPEPKLAWVGRVAPEKALEDALEAARKAGLPLQIFGRIQSSEYWRNVCDRFPDAPMEYMGFLPTKELQARLRLCKALLMTPRWVEAFGNVAIEALACGVPVIAYRRGGPSEIVKYGETGWLVEPDNVEELVEAVRRVDEIDRHRCRQQAEREYSLEALGDRFERWFHDILAEG